VLQGCGYMRMAFLDPPSRLQGIHYQGTASAEGTASNSPELVELKCPYSARDMTVEEATTSLKDFYIGEKNYTGMPQ